MSSDYDFDQKVGRQEADLARSHRAARRRNILIWALAVVSLLFGIVCLFLAMDNARLAGAAATYGDEQAQEKQSLAEEFDAACKSADFQQTAAGSNICRKAEQVASEPSGPLVGPQGLQGVPGPRGEQGFPGPAGPTGGTGPKGDKGDQGIMGLLGLTGSAGTPGPIGPLGPVGPAGPPGPPGATGAQGEPGADSTVPGPPGPAGAPGAPGADGATGPQGPAGQDGRGIKSAQCGDDGRWIITYTDGATSDAGQCRATITPPIGGTP
ncbi:hypothetical protein [Pseudarthrobacter sp. NamE5]|uniref:hypothetical protein n=1 Tax=Pseudarthrobacter sp. NamE5 TaxID=2576839 RepID=UPI00197AF8F7|nr:hypothetical protein [Pseudarthrobacter sp. NamE5]